MKLSSEDYLQLPRKDKEFILDKHLHVNIRKVEENDQRAKHVAQEGGEEDKRVSFHGDDSFTM
jgi:hypothetical protein